MVVHSIGCVKSCAIAVTTRRGRKERPLQPPIHPLTNLMSAYGILAPRWRSSGCQVAAKSLECFPLSACNRWAQSSMCDTPPKDYQDGEGALQAMNKQWLNGEGEQGDTIRMAAEVYKLIENFSEGRGVDTKNINQASRVLENYTQESSTEVAISGHNRLWIERNLAIQSKGQPFSSQGTPPLLTVCRCLVLRSLIACKTFRMARMARRAHQGGRGQKVCGVSGEVA